MRQHTLNLNALYNTVISSYSAAIADVAYGHAKRDPELLVFNFTFACDQDSGNIVFAMPLKAQLLMSRPYPRRTPRCEPKKRKKRTSTGRSICRSFR